MSSSLVFENVWTDRSLYEEAEQKYYENLSNNKITLTPLADEVAKARQRLNEIRDNFEPTAEVLPSVDAGAVKFMEKRMLEFHTLIQTIKDKMDQFETRLINLENAIDERTPEETCLIPPKTQLAPTKMEQSEDNEDVDLFGSESEDDEEANKVREERLAAYNAKKSKKPTLIAKSSIILDVKPWDDETDMKVLEGEVRKIVMDGLLWGASKLVPLAFGIHKLQITCVVEDEKVSVDMLQEQIEDIGDFVQSVDIAAFNKI